MFSTDAELIQKFLNGQNEAFNLLVLRWQAPIYSYLYRQILHREEAEDLAQQVFITVYNSLSRLKEHAKFKCWLYAIALNKARDYLRLKKRKMLYSISNDGENGGSDPALLQTETETLKNAHQKELEDLIKIAMNDVPEEQRHILILFERRKRMSNTKTDSWIRNRSNTLLKALVILLCVCFINCNFLYAQDSIKIDSHRQQVRLLEDLLETYMKQDDAAWKIEGEALSLEINQWGVIFFIQIGFKSQDNILFNLPYLEKNDNVQKPAVDIDSIKLELRTILTEFIREYTHTLSWLKPDERIMIVVNQNPQSGVGSMYGIPFVGEKRSVFSSSADKKRASVNFSLTVTNKVLDDYRRQRINQEGFNTQILYKELNETDQKEYSEFYRAIATLGTGFRSAIQQVSSRSLNDHDIQSIYIPGYGVIYTINIMSDFPSFNFLGLDSTVLVVTEKIMKNALSGIKIDSIVDSTLGKNGLEGLNNGLKKLNEQLKIVVQPKVPPRPQPGINIQLPGFGVSRTPENFKTISENLLSTIANFGHTLNLFKDTENITILLLSKNMFFSTHSQGKWIVSATMDDILKFHRQEITFEQFKERVKRQTY